MLSCCHYAIFVYFCSRSNCVKFLPNYIFFQGTAVSFCYEVHTLFQAFKALSDIHWKVVFLQEGQPAFLIKTLLLLNLILVVPHWFSPWEKIRFIFLRDRYVQFFEQTTLFLGLRNRQRMTIGVTYSFSPRATLFIIDSLLSCFFFIDGEKCFLEEIARGNHFMLKHCNIIKTSMHISIYSQ
jgi:hypothetical protein